MAIATPEQLRNRYLLVTIAPADPSLPDAAPVQIKCRRPDPLELAALGLLPLEIFGHVIALLQDQLEAALDPNSPRPEVPKHEEFARFLDRWVVAAAVAPRFVADQAEAVDGAMWVAELDDDIKLAIFRQTNERLMQPRVRAAVAEFRHEPLGAAAGSSGATVRDTPVGAVARV